MFIRSSMLSLVKSVNAGSSACGAFAPGSDSGGVCAYTQADPYVSVTQTAQAAYVVRALVACSLGLWALPNAAIPQLRTARVVPNRATGQEQQSHSCQCFNANVAFRAFLDWSAACSRFHPGNSCKSPDSPQSSAQTSAPCGTAMWRRNPGSRYPSETVEGGKDCGL
jgi:hypothetical protein